MSRYGRIQFDSRTEYLSNISIREAYPRIMEIFDEGFEDEVLSYMEDAIGEYVAVLTVAGINVIYTQDTYGFESLETVSDAELKELREACTYDEDEE